MEKDNTDLWMHDSRSDDGFVIDWKRAKELYEKMLLLEEEG